MNQLFWKAASFFLVVSSSFAQGGVAELPSPRKLTPPPGWSKRFCREGVAAVKMSQTITTTHFKAMSASQILNLIEDTMSVLFWRPDIEAAVRRKFEAEDQRVMAHGNGLSRIAAQEMGSASLVSVFRQMPEWVDRQQNTPLPASWPYLNSRLQTMAEHWHTPEGEADFQAQLEKAWKSRPGSQWSRSALELMPHISRPLLPVSPELSLLVSKWLSARNDLVLLMRYFDWSAVYSTSELISRFIRWGNQLSVADHEYVHETTKHWPNGRRFLKVADIRTAKFPDEIPYAPFDPLYSALIRMAVKNALSSPDSRVLETQGASLILQPDYQVRVIVDSSAAEPEVKEVYFELRSSMGILSAQPRDKPKEVLALEAAANAERMRKEAQMREAARKEAAERAAAEAAKAALVIPVTPEVEAKAPEQEPAAVLPPPLDLAALNLSPMTESALQGMALRFPSERQFIHFVAGYFPDFEIAYDPPSVLILLKKLRELLEKDLEGPSRVAQLLGRAYALSQEIEAQSQLDEEESPEPTTQAFSIKTLKPDVTYEFFFKRHPEMGVQKVRFTPRAVEWIQRHANVDWLSSLEAGFTHKKGKGSHGIKRLTMPIENCPWEIKRQGSNFRLLMYMDNGVWVVQQEYQE